MEKFGIEGVGINTIILFFGNKNWENITCLSLKAVQWFTICGTSPPSELAIGRNETKASTYRCGPLNAEKRARLATYFLLLQECRS